jgi:pimeloyl-ACP methyl ester carboxylesterase
MVVGYSMGGRLALYLALRHPERCSRLFLESASPGIDATEREARRRSNEEKVLRLESGNLASFLDDWYRQPLFASLTRREGLLQKTIGARLHNDPAELALVTGHGDGEPSPALGRARRVTSAGAGGRRGARREVRRDRKPHGGTESSGSDYCGSRGGAQRSPRGSEGVPRPAETLSGYSRGQVLKTFTSWVG